MRTLILTALFFALPANARAQPSDEDPFHDFRLSASVLVGTGHNAESGLTLSAHVNAAIFIPLVQNFGLRIDATFLAQPGLGFDDGGASVLSFAAGGDYTIGFGDGPWGLGLALGVGGAPWGSLDPGGFSTPGETIRGVVFYQEAALRRVIGIGLWEFGLRGDEFVGSGTSITNTGVFFRFSFRI